MKVGVDYYPEHWDASLWEQDAIAMKEAGVSVVRLAEFAWSRMEPTQGVFDFGWLDKAIAVLAAQGIDIVLGTPTATPPNWLVEAYPDVLPMDSKKQPMYPGVRCHRCYNSPSLKQFTALIVNEMTSRYANNQAVVGWQTDNELAANDCHCVNCTARFRGWLQDKYGTLENLNREWGTVVWSGEYSAWTQVTTPLGGSLHQNPSLLLDFQRFSSDSVAAFNGFQAGLIRERCTDQFVTHNLWGYPVVTDYYDLFKDMDFVSLDYYPSTDLKNDAKARFYHGALTHDLTRGVKQKNYWVMEQLSGTPGCWHPMSRTPFPGMIRAHAWQSISRGADVVVHFRWRTARVGAEQFWHGLHDHHGIPGRRFHEFKQFAHEVNRLSATLDGTAVVNDVAMLFSHEQHNAFKIQPQSDGFDYLDNFKQLHSAFLRLGVGTDVINWTADIDGYKVVVAPYLFLENAEVNAKLQRFAQAGGTVVLTTRTGVKNMHNVCGHLRLPGGLAELAGVEVEEYDPVGRDVQTLRFANADEHSCAQWCDILTPTSAQVVAHYASEYFAGRAAITRNSYQRGSVYYIGSILSDTGYQALFADLLRSAKLPYFENLPQGIEVSRRVSEGRVFLFVLNLGKDNKDVSLGDSRYVCELSGKEVSAAVRMDGGEVLILREV